MSSKLTEIRIVYSGDLYRFYVDSYGTIHLVLFYSLMGTSEKQLEPDEVPDEVMTEFETKYMVS